MNTTPLFIGGLGATELLIIGAIIVMMFGASKLPELARGSGQALRIFKAETKALTDDDGTDDKVEKSTVEANAHTDAPTSQTIIEPEPVVVTTTRSSSTD